MKISLAIISILISNIASSQLLQTGESINYRTLKAYSISGPDVFSFTANQASLGFLKQIQVGFSAQKKFSLSELGMYHFAFALPTPKGNFGLDGAYAGSESFNETRLGLAYARSLGDRIGIGAQFNYHGISIAGYGQTAAATVEAGLLFKVLEKLTAGIHINNPIGGNYGAEKMEKIPFVYSLGFGFDASDKFFLTAVVVKEEDQSINIVSGFQYKIIETVRVGFNIHTVNALVSGGVGFSWKNFHIDLTGSYHTPLGWTPGLIFRMDLKKSEL